MEVVVEEKCGNAPRKEILRDFNIAFASGDFGSVLARVRDDVVWEVVGEKTIEGRDAMAAELESMAGPIPDRLVIDSIITHGDTAAANGTLEFPDGSAYSFCDIYRFAGFAKTAPLKSIRSYVIRL